MKRKKKSSLSILALLISPRDPDFSVFSILLQKKRCFWLHDLQKENRREEKKRKKERWKPWRMVELALAPIRTSPLSQDVPALNSLSLLLVTKKKPARNMRKH